MDRNKFGINLDEGLPLRSEEEMSLLYLESQSKQEDMLAEWLSCKDSGSLMFGGQIGTGKTTLINIAFRKSGIIPDITFHFDRSSFDISILDAWVIIFAEIARFSIKRSSVFMTEIFPDIKNVFGDTDVEWELSIKEILLEIFSTNSIKKNNEFRKMLLPMLEHLPQLFRASMDYLEKQEQRRLLLFASGVDKYMPGKPAYFSLTAVLGLLADYRTLIEVNAVHLFTNDPWAKTVAKQFLPAASREWICQLLKKRLGGYADAYKNEIPLIADFSGGIPRQALRILDSYMAAKKKKSAAFKVAITSANRDFFAYGPVPQKELLFAVSKDLFLETTLISLPGDSEDAGKAVFGNWIILLGVKFESRWSAVINPILSKKWITVTTTADPEQILLTRYADQFSTSASGLNVNMLDSSSFTQLISAIEKPVPLNVTEILDHISSALFSKNRADRIIVGFENKEVLDAVRAYLEAKSNSYEFQSWKHILIKADDHLLAKQIICMLNDPTVDICSIEMNGDFSAEELEQLNDYRDKMLDKQIILWIRKKYLPSYLIHWTQLRQLFEVFILEENLSKFLSAEDIQADIDFMSDLVSETNQASNTYVMNLKKVLTYLKETKNG